jgi:hypothetical protein
MDLRVPDRVTHRFMAAQQTRLFNTKPRKDEPLWARRADFADIASKAT